VSLDELRIGTTWAAVTPAVIPEPGALGFLAIVGLGLLCSRRRLITGIRMAYQFEESCKRQHQHKPRSVMKTLIPSVLVTFLLGASAHAELLLYEPFDYTPGERLGGSGSSPVGKVAPNGKTWITRSPASANYSEERDIRITSGNLSYPGLATSLGNSIRYGTNAAVTVQTHLYTAAIDLPGDAITEGSIYYSMIVRFHSTIPGGGARTCYATFSEDPADPLVDAGYGVITAGGTANIPLPAGAWIRNSGTTDYHLGAGKQNGDGLGPGTGGIPGSPAWQSSAAPHPYPNQQGNTGGAGQDWATIEEDLYFIVIKYTFGDPLIPNDDKVGLWVSPIPSTLGFDAGEALASAAGGSYYSATNAYTTPAADLDATFNGIESFMLIANAQASTAVNKSIDVSLDELRIGRTWADVTPAAPLVPEITLIEGAGTSSVKVTWINAVPDSDYVLQYRTDLATGTWLSLPSVKAIDTTASQTDTPAVGEIARFYRVMKP
jgi:hypothetical protein